VVSHSATNLLADSASELACAGSLQSRGRIGLFSPERTLWQSWAELADALSWRFIAHFKPHLIGKSDEVVEKTVRCRQRV